MSAMNAMNAGQTRSFKRMPLSFYEQGRDKQGSFGSVQTTLRAQVRV